MHVLERPRKRWSGGKKDLREIENLHLVSASKIRYFLTTPAPCCWLLVAGCRRFES